MDTRHSSKPAAPSPKAPGASSRKKIVKALLRAVAVFGLAAGVFWPAALRAGEDSGTVAQKAFAIIGQPAQAQPDQAAAESSRWTVSAPDTPVRVAGAPSVDPGAAPAAPRIAEPAKTVSTAPAVLAGHSFRVGDRLKIAFYERVDVEEDKWGRAFSALRSIQRRPELSGEYMVQEDGTISIPLLGTIPVANRSAQQVQAAMVESFQQFLGHEGMVNVMLIERSPIYVLGPVKNPGSFKYVPGATVLHAIAVAGGLDRGTSDPWQKVEAVREIQKRSGAAGALMKLIARATVLKAERDGTTPKVPLRLMELVGATEATSLVNEQSDRRKTVALARKNRERAILAAVESAKQDLLIYSRTGSLDELIKLRRERVDSIRPLVERNVVSKAILSQVESELSDAEQRRQDAINQYGMAKQRLASLEAEGLRVQAEIENDLAVEIEAVERQIADNERELNASEGVLSSLPATRAMFAPSKEAANRVTYQIVRQTAAGPVSIPSSGMTLLQPGDLVNIIEGTGEATGQPTAPDATPAEALPIGRAAKDQKAASDQKIGRTIAQD
jgi:protein involved in polysaccharide export with SLBB domain